ncbi:hypothetical protein [Aestuariivita sp.]|jgi:TRAP-type uncharacterized transport system fused permease subunit|uniref:hypothetical protein n=1 Tax=Aestuariivita sp. TaxID=1872407 RepID=UPI00216EF5F3|nr:hypothetical protein [Aestuariivita sp.]MCE8006114.1 hypothetical protein [Aestuariivita sp.]
MQDGPADQIPTGILRTVGFGLFAYMAHGTLFGPYKTTAVHLAIFAAATLSIAFLRQIRSHDPRIKAIQWAVDILVTCAAVGSLLYIIIGCERLLNLWGSTYLTQLDVLIGLILVAVALEASRR